VFLGDWLCCVLLEPNHAAWRLCVAALAVPFVLRTVGGARLAQCKHQE
jgi:hypothetical protein